MHIRARYTNTMLYLITGNTEKRIQWLHKLLEQNKRGKQDISSVSRDDFETIDALIESIATQKDLFGDEHYYHIKDAAKDITTPDILNLFSESQNHIIFSEEKTTKKVIELFTQSKAVIEVFPQDSQSGFNQPNNLFALADHLGNRDKKNLWIHFHTVLQDYSPEEINGILLWQLKNMALVSVSQDSVPGMKPFVLKKNKKYITNYSYQEITDLIKRLTTSFHNRDRYYTLDLQLEKTILSL